LPALTARDRLEDKVAGLMQGQHDYLVKPFGMCGVTHGWATAAIASDPTPATSGG